MGDTLRVSYRCIRKLEVLRKMSGTERPPDKTVQRGGKRLIKKIDMAFTGSALYFPGYNPVCLPGGLMLPSTDSFGY